MADAPAAGGSKSGGSFGFLTRKIGPLPVIAWAGIGLGAYYWYTRYGPGKSTATTVTDPAGNVCSVLAPSGYCPGTPEDQAASGAYVSGGTGGGDGGGGATTPGDTGGSADGGTGGLVIPGPDNGLVPPDGGVGGTQIPPDGGTGRTQPPPLVIPGPDNGLARREARQDARQEARQDARQAQRKRVTVPPARTPPIRRPVRGQPPIIRPPVHASAPLTASDVYGSGPTAMPGGNTYDSGAGRTAVTNPRQEARQDARVAARKRERAEARRAG